VPGALFDRELGIPVLDVGFESVAMPPPSTEFRSMVALAVFALTGLRSFMENSATL
jgi:hypothetical protein